ncbi:uncharacterized protein ATC70_000179 [Mucor velutinosus]|uniref:Uncharacterized protein n=1 Tax=Mucor velutinosus TaxID=708070 RepID=A0AAN7DHR4_9FUNG|nr:hypothetical protein ATC70_000179 [Mucor velutinosus]
MSPTTRNRSAALQLGITSDTTTTAASPKRKTTGYRAGTKPKAANAAALTVASEAIDVRPTAEEIEQKKQQIMEEEEVQEEKKRKQQDKKNDNKRRNKLRDEAYQIVNDFKDDQENIWQALLAAINDFKLKRTKSKKPPISEMQIFRMCFAFYTLRFRHQTELNMSNYNKRYLGMNFCDKVGDWLLIFKKVDAALIEQNPPEETMLLYIAIRGQNDRSWRPCFLYFTAFIFSFFLMNLKSREGSSSVFDIGRYGQPGASC